MNSKILIRVTKESEIQEKKLVSEEYITDLYIYTKTPKLNLLYRKDTNKLYTINEEGKKLIEMQKNESKIAQINQLKNMISTVNIEESVLDKKKEYTIEGKGNTVTFNAKITTLIMEEISKTINYESYKKSQEEALFDLNLPSNELIENSTFNLNVQGSNIQTKTVIKNIDIIKENTNQYDYLYDYSYS